MRNVFVLLVAGGALIAQPQNRMQPGIQPFVSVNDLVIALLHVRVIDGTGDDLLEKVRLEAARLSEQKFAETRRDIDPRSPAQVQL